MGFITKLPWVVKKRTAFKSNRSEKLATLRAPLVVGVATKQVRWGRAPGSCLRLALDEQLGQLPLDRSRVPLIQPDYKGLGFGVRSGERDWLAEVLQNSSAPSDTCVSLHIAAAVADPRHPDFGWFYEQTTLSIIKIELPFLVATFHRKSEWGLRQ